MHLGDVRRGRDLAGADRPDGLIGDRQLRRNARRRALAMRKRRIQLSLDRLDSLAGFTNVQALADAENDG